MTSFSNIIDLFYFPFLLLLIIVLMVKRPIFILSLFIAQPWILNNIFFSFPGIPYVYLTYIIIGVGLFFTVPYKTVIEKPVIKITLYFILYILVQKIFNVNSDHSIGIIRFFIFVNFIPAIIIINHLKCIQDYIKLIDYTIIWLGVFQILFLVVLFSGFTRGGDFRATEILGINMQYANSALLIVTGLTALFSRESKLSKKLLLSFIVIGFIVLILSQSRTFLLGAIIITIVLTFNNIKKSFYIILISLLLVSLILFISSIDVGSLIFSDFMYSLFERTERLQTHNVDAISSGRIGLWTSALENWRTNPLFGVGIGNALINFPAYNGVIPRPHNLFIQILAELGLIGFSLFIIIIIKGILYLKMMNKENSFSVNFLKWAFYLFLFSNIFKADWGITFLLIILIERLYYIKSSNDKRSSINNNTNI